MITCGSQCILCDIPIRFDTYKGCSHGCKYCFANKKHSINDVSVDSNTNELIAFIDGKRNWTTKWCDWNIPLHWGGMSDPFQPIEKKYKVSKKCLEIFAKTQYPFVVSTKGALIGTKEYLDLIEKCNCVVQISAVCPSMSKIEPGCPDYYERLKIAKKVADRGKRTIIRIQPYMHEFFDEVYDNLGLIAEYGIYGVIVEGMKYNKKKDGLVSVAGDYCYPYDLIKSDFLKLKKKAHSLGLKIYAGENRIRESGDSLTCCGVDGMDGFTPNTFNINHIIHKDQVKPTEKMKTKGTGGCFGALLQNTKGHGLIQKNSFLSLMLYFLKKKRVLIETIFGVRR